MNIIQFIYMLLLFVDDALDILHKCVCNVLLITEIPFNTYKTPHKK